MNTGLAHPRSVKPISALDTNVISELRKPTGRRDPGVEAWFATVPDDSIFLSVLVLGEIRCAVERIRRRDLAAAEALDTWLAQLRANYAGRILPVDATVADLWGKLNVPDPMPAVDGLLAATALAHGLTLVTPNVRDVARFGVATHNPFTG